LSGEKNLSAVEVPPEMIKEYTEWLNSEDSDVIQFGLAAQLWQAELGIEKWSDYIDSPMYPLVKYFLAIDLAMSEVKEK